MKLTHSTIHEAGSYGGHGFNAQQLALLGVQWPPAAGWLRRLVGTEVSDETWQKVLSLRGVREKQKRADILGCSVGDLKAPGSKARNRFVHAQKVGAVRKEFRNLLLCLQAGEHSAAQDHARAIEEICASLTS